MILAAVMMDKRHDMPHIFDTIDDLKDKI